jgi:hypothetical protein
MVFAPNLNIALPVTPNLPTLAHSPNNNWLVAAGNTLYFIGQLIWYFFSYIVYMFSVVGVMFSVVTLSFIPPIVGTVIGAFLMVLLIGSILMFLRGYSEGTSK